MTFSIDKYIDPEKSKIQFYLNTPHQPFIDFNMQTEKLVYEDGKVIAFENKKNAKYIHIIFKNQIASIKILNVKIVDDKKR